LSFSAAGTALDMNGNSETIGSLASASGFGMVTSSSAGTITLNTGGNNTSTTYTGLIEDGSGTVLLTKSGSGQFTLSTTANTYSGLTTVGAGILEVRHSSSLGSVAGGTSVTNGATLYVNNNISVGNESLTINGVGNAGSLRSTGGTNVWGGTITLGSASTIFVDNTSLTLSNSSSISSANLGLTISGNGSSTVSGTVSLGTGTLTTNNGTVTLMTGNSYSGLTSVLTGSTLNIRNNVSLGTSSVSVANGATLQLQGGITVSNALTLNGLGVSNVGSLRSISGVNEYSGTITLSTNTVRINTDLNSLLISGNIVGGSIPLYFGSNAGSGSVTVTVSGVISGSGGSLTWGTNTTLVPLLSSVVKDNNFLTLVLSTSNSYTGATVLGSTANVNGGSGGGTLLLGASDVINNSSHIVFNGGSLNTGGYGETVGALSVLQDGGVLTLGNSVHELRFSGLGTLDYKTLTISGWQGTAGSTGTMGEVFVGSSLFFTRAQLDQFKFSYNSGTFSSIQLSSGELVPDVNTVSNRSNIRITAGATTNGSWSPAYNTSNNTTYTFTPSANNATINVTEIATLLNTRYSNVIINTTFAGATQVGQVDFATALSTTNPNNVDRTLTVNGGGDVNISSAITLGFTDTRNGWPGYRAHSLSVTTAGNINVSAAINARGALDMNANTNSMPDGGSVTLSSTVGVVRVTSQITASGALHTGNTNLAGLTGGSSGNISISGAGGVSISAPLVALGSTNGAVTISTGNAVVTSGGVNDGVSGVMSGLNFTKNGVGVLRISGLNNYTGTTVIGGGTLQLGSGTSVPDASAVNFTGGDLNDGGFSETMGALNLSSNATLTLGNTTHSLTFNSAGTFVASRMLSIVGYNGVDATSAVTSEGAIKSTATNFVTFSGQRQSQVMGGLNQFGRILYGMSGATGNPANIFVKSALSGTQLNQIQFYNNNPPSYYSTSQKANPSFEIVPNALK
jgi:autotransporter-associated beta strand protein